MSDLVNDIFQEEKLASILKDVILSLIIPEFEINM